MKVLQASLCWAIILLGSLRIYATLDDMKAKKWWADMTTPTVWVTGPCKPLSVAIPDAVIDSRGWIILPARNIMLDSPVCEFVSPNNISGSDSGQTVITLGVPK